MLNPIFLKKVQITNMTQSHPTRQNKVSFYANVFVVGNYHEIVCYQLRK